ncbi:MAG: transposase [Bacteroidetes bacterium]|nr:transposase [Bacteroidota bacterium]
MPPRSLTPAQGEYYHVYNRGACKMTLYHSPDSYILFLKLATKYAKKYRISLIAICLMPNHFHLVVRVDEEGQLDMFMQMLCGVFSRKQNELLRRTGTIYEGRYQIRHVRDDAYFKTLCRYVHRNPVKAGLVDHPLKWKYSNYAEVIGSRSFLSGDHQAIVTSFGGRDEYEAFVMLQEQPSTDLDEKLAQDLVEMYIL